LHPWYPWVQNTTQDKCLLQIDFIGPTDLLPRAALRIVHRGRRVCLRSLRSSTISEFTGPLWNSSTIEFVMRLAGIDQWGRDNGQRPPYFDYIRASPKKRFGTLPAPFASTPRVRTNRTWYTVFKAREGDRIRKLRRRVVFNRRFAFSITSERHVTGAGLSKVEETDSL